MMFYNPRFYGIALFILLTSFTTGAFIGYDKGVEIERGVCNSSKNKTIQENIEINEKQNAIIRLDDTDYIDSLRNGTF